MNCQPKRSRVGWVRPAWWAAVLAAGCHGGATPSAAQREASAFKTLTLAYMQFVRDHGGKLPKEQDEFKQYVGQSLATYLSNAGLSVDAAFQSPRDGQEYVFFSQQHPPPVNSEIVGYEQSGSAGVRYIGDRSGTVIEVDSAQFAQLGLATP